MNARRLFLTVIGLLGSGLVAQAQFAWSGLGTDRDITTAGNWRGGLAPVFDGTEDIVLGKAINNDLYLSGDAAVNSITLTSGDDYHWRSSTVVLRIGSGTGNGIYGSVGNNSRLVFNQSIDLSANGAGNLRMDAGDGTLAFAGKIIDDPLGGVTTVYLSNANGGTTGSFVFNDTCTGSSYTGDTYIQGIAGTPVVVAFWNSQPFGLGGTVHIRNGATLIAHGSQRVDNDIIFHTTLADDPIYLRSWDDVLCFDGDITLRNNTTLVAQRTPAGVPSGDNSGVFTMPGALARHIIDFEETIDESGGAHRLTVNGAGIILLQGTNSYSGGTVVGGSLIFGTANSAPGTNQVTVNSGGYAGFADTTAGEFANYLANKVDHASTGSIGIDTLPGDSTYTFADAINLATFTDPNIRIGSATSAILTGNITPQGANYRFGNGGGTLYVQSNLTGVGRGVTMSNASAVPLTLYLQGNNSYTGATQVNNGFVIFDFDAALPAATVLTASTAGGSYIGYTDAAAISPATFLGQFNKPGTNGIIGFDTHAGSPTVVIPDNLDLSTFTNASGVYLGTSTSAILTGTLTPTPDHILRLTAALGGRLEVDSIIADTLGPVSVAVGTNSPNDVYSNGTVSLMAANTYTGGTTINSTGSGTTLEVGDNSALGTGSLTLGASVNAGLQSGTPGVNLPNNVALGAGSHLYVTGSNDLQLSGNLSGPGSITVINPVADPVLTLSGNNSAFSGDISLYNSTLVVDANNAAGTGTLRFLDTSSQLDFTLNAPNPLIYGLQGNDGYITMDHANALTIDMSNASNDHDFGGTFDDGGSGASLTVTSSTGGDALYLYGTSTYSGGTFIGTSSSDKAALALGSDSNQALGSGPVTLNTSMNGALVLNVGVTFNSDLNYKGGVLEGFGTYAPRTITEGGSLVSAITLNAGKGVAPGVYGLGSKNTPGTLTIKSGVDFANGGAMLWSVQDGTVQGLSRGPGFSTLVVDGSTGGNLNISATAGGFTLFLASVDSAGGTGAPTNLTAGSNNSFIFATVINGASITNFNAANFTVDTSLFATPVSSVFVTQVGNDLFVNFTPVPEPSTYALLALGLGVVLFPSLRRRTRV